MQKIKRAVCLLAFNEHQQILAIGRRHDASLVGLIGGKVDPGEHEVQALVRETAEEAGLTISPEELIPLHVALCPGGSDGIAFWTTTYLLLRPLGAADRLQAENGLTLSFRPPEDLVNPSVSPFAGYNVGVQEALAKFNLQTSAPSP